MRTWKLAICTVTVVSLVLLLTSIAGCSSTVIKAVKVVDSFAPEQASPQPPVVDNNTVYYGSDRGFIYAIDAANGKVKWKQKIPARDKTNTANLPDNPLECMEVGPVISNGIIYGANDYETFFAFDTSKRRYLWKTWVDNTSGLQLSIDIYNNALFFNGYGINALSTAKGEKKTISLGDPCEELFPPLVEDGTIYCASNKGYIYAINETEVEKNWKTDIKKCGLETREYIVFNAPAKLGNILFFTSNAPNVYAVDANNGSLIWKFKGNREIASAPAIGNNSVFVSFLEAECVYAFDAKTGKIKWRFKTGPEGVSARPLVQGNILYIGGWDRKIHALDTETGKEIWHYDVGDQIGDDMAIDSKAIYFRTHYAGSIKAVSLKTHKEIWSTRKK